MRALQITKLTGPRTALTLADVPEPEASHLLTPGRGVVVDVHAAGVSFPEVLQTRGEYQMRPELPFVPGSEAAGTVRSAPEGSGFAPGDRVAAFCLLGGWAETAVAPEFFVARLPAELDFAQGAGLILNYHTAWFSLVLRGRLQAGETVLVHGAAGGVGTASLLSPAGHAGVRPRLDVAAGDRAHAARRASFSLRPQDHLRAAGAARARPRIRSRRRSSGAPTRLAKKVAAGAQFIQTQYCYDVPLLRHFMRRRWRTWGCSTRSSSWSASGRCAPRRPPSGCARTCRACTSRTP